MTPSTTKRTNASISAITPPIADAAKVKGLTPLLFGVAGRELLDRLKIPQPWRATVDASLALWMAAQTISPRLPDREQR
jgi:hypothetical protein